MCLSEVINDVCATYITFYTLALNRVHLLCYSLCLQSLIHKRLKMLHTSKEQMVHFSRSLNCLQFSIH